MAFPLEIITEKIEEDRDEPKYVSEYVSELEDRLRESHEVARRHLKASAIRQKFSYNTNANRHNYDKGDLVWRNQKKNVPGLKLKISRH